MYRIGVDIGGMSIKIGVVDFWGKILFSSRVKTVSTAEQNVKNIANEILLLLKDNGITVSDISGIGIGCPGLICSETGVVESNSNLGWNEFPIVSRLKSYFNVEIKLSNDANVAALAEVKYGVAKNYKNAIMLTLGTGVGGGIIIDKKLYEGGYSKGAELGHICIKERGEKCGCGRRGCLEAYASATALIRDTKRAMEKNKDSLMWKVVEGDIDKVDGRTSFECAKKGDSTANKVVNNFVRYLSEGILSLLNIFRPEVVIIGGGICAQGDYLLDKLRRYCKKYDYGYKNAPKAEIVAAELGNDAGIIGAAALIEI